MEMLAPHSVKGIRLDSHLHVQYGEREITTAKHRCICRACGQPILKGGQRYTFFHDFRYTFFHDFTGSDSWTTVESHIHLADCTWVLSKQGSYGKSDPRRKSMSWHPSISDLSRTV